jgi:hypothetical protein
MKDLIKQYISNQRNFNDFDYEYEEIELEDQKFMKLKLIFKKPNYFDKKIFFVDEVNINKVILFLKSARSEIKSCIIKDIYLFCYFNYDIDLFKKILKCNKETECSMINEIKYNSDDYLYIIKPNPDYIETYIKDNIKEINRIK